MRLSCHTLYASGPYHDTQGNAHNVPQKNMFVYCRFVSSVAYAQMTAQNLKIPSILLVHLLTIFRMNCLSCLLCVDFHKISKSYFLISPSEKTKASLARNKHPKDVSRRCRRRGILRGTRFSPS